MFCSRPILEDNANYPHGLKIQGISARAALKPKTKEGYQGDFAEQDDETGYNEFDLRIYDPQIGRWIQVDPYDEYPNGYAGMGNNSINDIDPDGGIVAKTANSGFSFFNILGLLGSQIEKIISEQPIPKLRENNPIPIKGQLYFASADAAAIDWGKRYNGVSIRNDKEYHSFIYSISFTLLTGKKVKYYAYTPPILGNEKKIPFVQIDKSYKELPVGAKAEYDMHSHGRGTPHFSADEEFSEDQGFNTKGYPIEDLGVQDYYKIGGFFTAPSGLLRVQRKDEGRPALICDCLERDPSLYTKPQGNEVHTERFRNPDNIVEIVNPVLTSFSFTQAYIDAMKKK